VAAGGAEPRSLANWIVNEVAARLDDADVADSRLEPAALARLVAMVEAGEVAQSAAKEVLGELVDHGGEPDAIVQARGLGRAGSDELEQIVERAMTENADAVEKIRAGNDKAIGAVVGAVMRETKGRADGGEVQRMIRERIGV
jgi:aspartyl-tRNA(Asn)/glutamyl-tRNA(Gln) amidotransferase subunit B